jgi:hypothetical protein
MLKSPHEGLATRPHFDYKIVDQAGTSTKEHIYSGYGKFLEP